jgi:hypothetical protein
MTWQEGNGASLRGGDTLSNAARRVWLLAILAVALGLRLFHVSWALPGYVFPDGMFHFLLPAARLAALGDFSLSQSQLIHPPVTVYAVGIVFKVWSLVSGGSIHVNASGFETPPAVQALLGRCLIVVLATLSVGALYLVARRLVGTRAALLAAAAFALSPLHVLESHRLNPDQPMVLLALLAAHQALIAEERGSRARLWFAFAIGGLAGAAKYTGLAATTVPAWIAVRWRDMSWSRRLFLLVGGGAAALAGFAFGMAPIAVEPSRFFSALHVLIAAGAFGMPGTDLFGRSWTNVRYVYPLVVALPYMMGWAVYGAAVIGFILLARSDRRAFAVVVAGAAPVFVVQGGSPVVVARYFEHLAPYLALTAGVALDRLWTRLPAAGLAVTVGVLGYTGLLAGAQVMRLDSGPQNAAGAFVAERARVAGRPLTIAYPSSWWLFYDTLRTKLPTKDVKIVFFPLIYQNVRAEPHEDPAEAEWRERDRDWVASNDVDVVVLPDWVELAVMRERPDGYAGSFYRRLEDGTLGFHQAAYFRSHYPTEALYVWGEPMLRTHWETGISGYKIFVRDTPGAAARGDDHHHASADTRDK